MADSESAEVDPPVGAFLAGVADPARREDCRALLEILRAATGREPRMWGAIVGFGDLHYRYASGREGDTFVLGFAARKADLTLYLGAALAAHEGLLAGLGKHKAGKGCLSIRRLADIDVGALGGLLAAAVAHNTATAAPTASAAETGGAADSGCR